MEEKKDSQIILMLKNRKYLLLSFFFSILVLILYPLFQILPLIFQNPANFWFSLKTWFSLLTPLRWAFYLLYGILFGLTLSFFIWQRFKKVCPSPKRTKRGFFGLFGSFFSTSAPLCPGCLSWAALFLPASLGLYLVKYSIEIMVFGILLLVLALWFLGGFKKN